MLSTKTGSVRLYVSIQEVRFYDRLDVSFDIAPEALDAGSFKDDLQPLLEDSF